MIIVAGDDVEGDPESWAQLAFSSVAERMDILDDRYPFVVERGALEYAGASAPGEVPYLALLCLTIVHAWNLKCGAEPTEVLEDTVVRVMRTHHLRATTMGTSDRADLSFVENLRARGEEVGLSPSADPRPRAASAKDAGVDTLATLLWPDNRQGQWTFIGQVTCENSSGWKRKLKEPEPAKWMNYLQEGLPPQAFLAVPHHIDHRAWSELMAPKAGLLLDRLRICLLKTSNSPEERTMVDCVLGCVPQ